MSEISIKLDNGKYEVKETASGSLIALRHGEVWRDLCGDNLIYNMAYEIESLRAQLEAQSGEAVRNVLHCDRSCMHTGRCSGNCKDNLAPPAAKVPDYLVTLRAMQLFDGEYVGQSRAPLWDWAYNKAAQEGEK